MRPADNFPVIDAYNIILFCLRQVRERLKEMGILKPMNIFLRQEIDRMQKVSTLWHDIEKMGRWTTLNDDALVSFVRPQSEVVSYKVDFACLYYSLKRQWC